MNRSLITTNTIYEHPLVLSILTCLVMILLGTGLVGTGVETWYVNLEKPAFLVPIWGFYLVGVLYYVLFGVVIYRIAAYIDDTAQRRRLLRLTVFVMLLNELWNFAFFGLESTLAGFFGMIVFLVPVVILTVRLVSVDRVSGTMLIGYSLWVIYDIAWAYALWQMNT